ncbi:unnamed protein product [Effrenium voratum]|nr:unnamed protein product [Effrenium voratum]
MDFDLVNEPSTAEVMMGARSRGRADPRAVAIEADEFDFDPNPLPSVSSATRAPNTVTAASTGIDVVDPEELKRRIRGDGTPAQLREGALRTLEMITKLARDRPRMTLAAAVIAVLLLSALVYTRHTADVEAAQTLPTTPSPEIVNVETREPTKSEADPLSVHIEPQNSVSGTKDSTAILELVRKEHQLLRGDILSLRRDVQEVKQLLTAERSNAGASAVQESAAPVAQQVQVAQPAGADQAGEIRVER